MSSEDELLRRIQVTEWKQRSEITKELNDHIEILGEAIQTILRKYNITNAYEKTKTLLRGQNISLTKLQNFIDTLQISTKEKITLKNLSPTKYIGLAKKLVESYKLKI